MKSLYRSVLILSLCLSASSVRADMTRVLSAGFGFGVPQLFFAEGQVQFAKNWQLGFGFSFFPISTLMGGPMPLPSQDGNLSDGTPFTYSPTLTSSFSVWSPFLRWFTSNRDYYLQFSYTMMRLNADITGEMELVGVPSAVKPILNMNLVLVQPMPTLSVGKFYHTDMYYFNITIGASFFFTPFTSITATSLIPEALGGTAGNEAAINEMKAGIDAAFKSTMTQISDSIYILPGIHLAFGFFL